VAGVEVLEEDFESEFEFESTDLESVGDFEPHEMLGLAARALLLFRGELEVNSWRFCACCRSAATASRLSWPSVREEGMLPEYVCICVCVCVCMYVPSVRKESTCVHTHAGLCVYVQSFTLPQQDLSHPLSNPCMHTHK
jgi:hypothetical protein